MISTLQVII